MFEVYALLIICTTLAYYIKNEKLESITSESRSLYLSDNGRIALFFLMAILIWFSGTRTTMNDTYQYLYTFRYQTPTEYDNIINLNWSIGGNPLFNLYRIFLKAVLGMKGQGFIFLSAVLVQCSMVKFLKNYSVNFGFSTYLYIAYTVYAFTLAAMKQTMATAIGIWAVPLIQKKKTVKAFVILIIAALVHPYIIILGSAVLFVDQGIFNRRIVITLILTVVSGLFFTQIMESVIRVADAIGDTYIYNYFEEGTGVGIARILSYYIAPIFAFFSRFKIREKNDAMQQMFINLSIVAACFSTLSGIGGAVLLGRMPCYFDLLICLSIPYILENGSPNIEANNRVIKVIIAIAYAFFYFTYYNKYFSSMNPGFFGSIYDRVSIGELVRTW